MPLNPLFATGPVDPDTTPQVSAEATTLFNDDFTDLSRWTTGGTAPSVASGQVTFASNTTASTVSTIRSNATFPLRIGSYLRPVFHVRYDASAVANVTRWWGIGTPQTSPTASAPVLNGAVFELRQSDGTLWAVTYSGGTRTEVAQLTRPTDGGLHRYEVWYQQRVVYWLVDSNPAVSKTFPNLAQANNLPLTAGLVNGTTAPSTAPTLVTSTAGVGDHSGTAHAIVDGGNTAAVATVKTGQSPAPASTDNPLQVQALLPASQSLSASAAANTAVTLTLPAPAAGLRHHITSVTFERFAAAALTAAASPIVTGGTNQNGWYTHLPAEAAAQGTLVKDTRNFVSPLAATAQATATTFTVSAVSSVIWRITATWYLAP